MCGALVRALEQSCFSLLPLGGNSITMAAYGVHPSYSTTRSCPTPLLGPCSVITPSVYVHVPCYICICLAITFTQ